MKKFTDTAAGRKRIARVANVIRDGLGLGSLPTTYAFMEEGTGYAAVLVKQRGWVCYIEFYPKFFTAIDLEEQLHTLVHEMVHVALHPLGQAVYHIIDRLPKSKAQRAYDEFDRADEIVADHLVGPLLKLLRPQIMKVL